MRSSADLENVDTALCAAQAATGNGELHIFVACT